MEKTTKLCILHCKFASGHFYLCIISSGFAALIVVLLYTHGHRAYFPDFQLFNSYLSLPYRRGVSFIIHIPLQHADQKNADENNSHLATTSHTLRICLCIKPKQTSTRREHEKHITGITIQATKSGFLGTCVQSGLAADNTGMQAQLLCITAGCLYL